VAGRILVGGIGNIFRGDDGFGVEVARRLASRALPRGVRVVDFGIRGHDLAFALAERWELAILVDAARRGGPPGTLYTIEPDLDALLAPSAAVETHGLHPARAFALVRALGAAPPPLRIVACEPLTLGDGEDEVAVRLSAPVEAAVEPAAALVLALVAEALGTNA
jgi:hydrogenase maturation protease